MVFGQLIKTNNYGIKEDAGKLEKTYLTGSIVHSFATLTFHEQFKTTNSNNCSIYINPPEGCVVYNVKGKYNDKLTEFVVHKLEEPVFSGYYDANSNSDAISLTIGEIPKDTIVTVEITCTFTAFLTSSNSFIFNIPTENNLLNSQFSTNINISMLKKNMPKINISEGVLNMNKNNLVLSPFTLNKPFQIIFDFQHQIESAAFSSQIDNFNYIGFSIHPTSLKKDINLKQEIYLLIDCSGSMSGSKIIDARNALVKFLNSLPENCYFNILRFGSTFERMFKESVKNNKENISKSLAFASWLEADLGGTEIYSPLMSIIDEKTRKGYVRQVFVLTDGQVENEAHVLSACTAKRHIMRIFPFGIGNDVNRAFLKDLAKSTSGKAHFIGDGVALQSISDTVLKTLSSSQVSVVVNPQIHIEGVDSFEVAPHPIPSLFDDCLTHLIIRYEKRDKNETESILISGEAGDSSFEETLQVVKIGNSINFQKLFAYNNIRDMEDKLMNLDESITSEMIRENIIRLSMQCGVVSSFTGMFTVINGIEQKAQNYQQQGQYASAMQSYQQQTSCQQGMTQRQCWAQDAYINMPMQQMAQDWGAQQGKYYYDQQDDYLEEQEIPPNSNHDSEQVQNDPFVEELIEKQNKDGSWTDISILQNIVNLKKQNPTIKDLLNEFPSVDKELANLNIQCVITLLVIGWLYTQRSNIYNRYNEQVMNGLNFVRSKTNKKIDDDITKNFNITSSISWKFHSYFI